MANNQDLPTILRAALRAYEQARAVRLQAERQASAQKERATAEINAAEQSERARLEASQRGQRALAEAEQARLGELAAAVTGLEEAARTALAQAGLAHIAGAPTAVDGAPAKARRGDAEVSDLFVQAQTGYVALREALYRLAAAQVEVGQGEAARQTLQPLLADGASPFFPAASALRRDSYLRPAREALAAQAWETVRATLAPWLKENKADEEARELERQSYLRPAQQALEAGQWEAVRVVLTPWLNMNKADEEAKTLERDSYLRPAREALEAGQWEAVRTTLEPWMKHNKGDRRALELAGESYFHPAQQALAKKDHAGRLSCLIAAATYKPSIPDAQQRLQSEIQTLLDWVTIPDGEFLYGDNKQRIFIPEFRISRTPITNAQYKIFIDVTGREQPSHWSNGRILAAQENHPVVNVSWDDAQAFCGWAGLRLPTEQQWEKAARGADGRAYPWGNQAPSGDLCNFNSIVGGTTPVGHYPKGASPYGLLDMAGNVWEWCETPYSQSVYVLRGGAYNNDASLVGCAYRNWDDQNLRYAVIGFRVVRP